ncbi:hypothetical protein GEV33_003614 [Tenebrio molitor]|uniref:Uncharacterized protein n=1 Tax=Tenebrio molitor TaxID=7067 RepID=A0A8J6HRU1_TENMO|nr:hypothetical protein GEV33_003614 [Tenebrio molitor]
MKAQIIPVALYKTVPIKNIPERALGPRLPVPTASIRERRGKYIKVEQTPCQGVLDRFSTSSGQRLRPIRVCWRTRGGRPIRLGNRPRRIPTETSRRIKASFTRVIDPTLQRINFTTLLGRRHPPGPHRRAGPHTGRSLAEEPESRSNSYLARECRGEEGPRGLSEDTDGVIGQRRKKDSEGLPPALALPGTLLGFQAPGLV